MKLAAILLTLVVLVSGCLDGYGVSVGSSDSTESQHATGSGEVNPTVADTPAETTGENRFNLEIDLPESYRTVSPGDEIWFTTKLLNLANERRVDVTLTYQILDSSKQIKFSKSETVAVETQASFVGNIKAPESLSTGLHYLRVDLQGPAGSSTSETTFEVTKEKSDQQIVIQFSLFDIVVDIPENYKRVRAGDELLTSISLINVGSGGRIDIFLDYWITDIAGNTVLSEKETVAVETQNNFVRTFDIPDDTEPGDYTFHAKLSYPDLELEPEYATGFEVQRSQTRNVTFIIFEGFAFLAAISLLYWKKDKIKRKIEKTHVRSRVKEIVKKRQN